MKSFANRYRVGHCYDVPCVRLGDRYVPILGDLHRDVELSTSKVHGPADMHWHYDFRFISDREMERLGMAPEFQPAYMGFILRAGKTAQGCRHVGTEVVMQRKRCARQLPEFPVSGGNIARILEPLYAARTIDPANPLCPHRGFDLAGIKPDAQGCVTCPLHGLRWDLQTGAMVSRREEETPRKRLHIEEEKENA